MAIKFGWGQSTSSYKNGSELSSPILITLKTGLKYNCVQLEIFVLLKLLYKVCFFIRNDVKIFYKFLFHPFLQEIYFCYVSQ